MEPRPAARERILAAAKDMLVTTSLVELSMDELAKAADVSRGTLYRIVPGKAALLQGLIEVYSPFEAIRSIIDEPPRRTARGRAPADRPDDRRASRASASG